MRLVWKTPLNTEIGAEPDTEDALTTLRHTIVSCVEKTEDDVVFRLLPLRRVVAL
jgi:hypothetical protein